MKKVILLLILLYTSSLFSQKETTLKINTFSEVELLYQQNKKPIVVFIYTDWCKFCHGMQKTTFRNKKVIKLLNNNFYFIELNAEEKEDIKFLGRTFKYNPTGTNTGFHQLAKDLATKNKTITYPTTVVLNTSFEIDAQINQYLNSKNMIKILESTTKK